MDRTSGIHTPLYIKAGWGVIPLPTGIPAIMDGGLPCNSVGLTAVKNQLTCSNVHGMIINMVPSVPSISDSCLMPNLPILGFTEPGKETFQAYTSNSF